MEYGGHSMVNTLRRVLLKRPDSSLSADPQKWHYTSTPDVAAAEKEHDKLAEILRENGVQVDYHEVSPSLGLADSIFVHDTSFMTNKGAIILQMGKALRRDEPAEVEKTLTKLGIPILYRLHDSGTAEGGDIVWLDETTIGVGRGFRTNGEGIRQLRECFGSIGVKVLEFHLPYFWGPDACLHLQSVVSFVGKKKAVVYAPLCPVPLIQELKERGYTLIEVPQNEFEQTQGTNVLCLKEGKVLTLENNPETKKRMEAAGLQVLTYQGNEITLKTEGGATCLVR